MSGWQGATTAAELAGVHLDRQVTVFSDNWQVMGILHRVEAKTETIEISNFGGDPVRSALLERLVTLQVGPWTGDVPAHTPVLVTPPNPSWPTSGTKR